MLIHELDLLIEKHPLYVPVVAAANFLHMNPAALRAAIDQNRCPFGFSWKIGDRAGYKIPTIAFVSWLTKGTFTSAS